MEGVRGEPEKWGAGHANAPNPLETINAVAPRRSHERWLISSDLVTTGNRLMQSRDGVTVAADLCVFASRREVRKVAPAWRRKSAGFRPAIFVSPTSTLRCRVCPSVTSETFGTTVTREPSRSLTEWPGT